MSKLFRFRLVTIEDGAAFQRVVSRFRGCAVAVTRDGRRARCNTAPVHAVWMVRTKTQTGREYFAKVPMCVEHDLDMSKPGQ